MCEDLFEPIFVPDNLRAPSPSPNVCSPTMTSIRMKQGKYQSDSPQAPPV
jgi:hypothetical protein